MGGVNSQNSKRRKPPVIGALHSQPPPFKATGHGLANKLPTRFVANAHNCNVVLTNKSADPSVTDLHKIYLFVDGIQTGYALAGSTAQTQLSRSFYPSNLSQDDLVITGMTPSQYEYDKLVRFVLHHHYTQFVPNPNAPLDSGSSYQSGVDFKLYKPTTGKTFNAHPPLHYMIVVSQVAAGHQRFESGVPFQLTCKVTFDFLQRDDFSVATDPVTVKQVFGDVHRPNLTTNTKETSTTTSTTQATQKSSNSSSSGSGGSTTLGHGAVGEG